MFLFCKRALSVALLVVIDLGSTAYSQTLKYPTLTQAGFDQMVSLHQEVLKHCPPQDCLRVYVGRSSALLMAYGEAIHLGSSQVGLPLSGMKTIQDGQMGEVLRRFSSEVLDPILKPSVQSGFSKIAVIDFVNGGSTLVRTAEMIQQWLQQSDLKIGMEVLGYGGVLSSEIELRLQSAGLAINRLPFSIGPGIEGDFSEIVYNSKSEGYAPYDRWNPIETASAPVVQRSLRKPYHYRGPKNETAYASYEDLVEWMKKPQLLSDCDLVWQYRNFVN